MDPMQVKEALIIRPSRGKPSVFHSEVAIMDVRAAILSVGLDNAEKVAGCLRKLGYAVEMRDFTGSGAAPQRKTYR